MDTKKIVVVTSTPLDESRAAGCEIKESNVVISTTDVSGSSVTVSVMCPEIPPKSKTVLWKKKTCPENMNEKVRRGDAEPNKTTQKPNCKNDSYVDAQVMPNVLKEITSLEKLCKKMSQKKPNAIGLETRMPAIADTPTTSAISNEDQSVFMIGTNRPRRSPIDKSKAQSGNYPDSAGESDQSPCFLLPHQKDGTQFMDASDSIIIKNQTDFIGGIIGIVRKLSGSSRSNTMEIEVNSNSSKESENNVRPFQLINNLETIDPNKSITEDNTEEESDSGLNRFLLQFAESESSKRKELLKEVEQVMKPFTAKKENLKGDWLETLTAPMDNNQRMELIRHLNLRDRILAANPTRKDLVTMKYLLKPLINMKEHERKKYMEIIRRFLPKTSDNYVTNAKSRGAEENSRHLNSTDNDQSMDVDDSSQNDNGNANRRNEIFNLKVSNVSLTSPDRNKEPIIAEIKVEREDEDTEAMQSTPNR